MKKIFIALLSMVFLLGTFVPTLYAAQDPTNQVILTIQKTYAVRSSYITDSRKQGELNQYYKNDSKILAFEKERPSFYAKMAQNDNINITGVTSQIEVVKTDLVSSTEVTVSLYEKLFYTWLDANNGINKTGMGIDHKVSLIKQQNKWIITADQYDEGILTRAVSPDYTGPLTISNISTQLPLTPTNTTSQQTITPNGIPGATSYNRAAAANYADSYYLNYNPSYVAYSGTDCANFVSQSMYAGGAYFINPYQQLGTNSWWYNGSLGSTNYDKSAEAWRYCPTQRGFLLGYRASETTLSNLKMGDLIYYDWGGDGVWDHVAIVSTFDSTGNPLVDCHTSNLYHAQWTLGGAARYSYIHISDVM